jgi:hypothetical protein
MIEKYLNTSISHGTLKSVDLYEAFMPVLEDISPADADEFKNIWEAEITLLKVPSEVYSSGEMMSELFDVMDSHSPDGYHFGSIEGDGSDFGYWSES